MALLYLSTACACNSRAHIVYTDTILHVMSLGNSKEVPQEQLLQVNQ